MDRLGVVRLYVAVADAHSFARIAEVLGQPRSMVLRVVKELGAWLGAQSLQCTTRKLSATAEGRRYYEECKRLLAEMATVEAPFPGCSIQPAGRSKVGTSQSLVCHCILPRIGELLQQYPDLELIFCSSDNMEDIIQEGFDCVICTGRIEDSITLVAHPLARYRWMVLASPIWLTVHGRLQSVDDLHQYRAMGYLNHRTRRIIDWPFSLDDGDYAIRMQETLVVDDTDAYIQTGIQGLDLICVASYLV